MRILNLEDDPIDSELASELLNADGLSVEIDRVDSLPAFQQALEQGSYALILSDYTVPGMDTLEALRLARTIRPEVPFVFLSGTMGEDQAIETLKLGASDYVLKQRTARLGPAVRRALKEAEEQSLRRRAEEALKETDERFRAFMDNSPTIAWMKDEEGRHVYLSKSYEKRFGVKFEDWRGKTDFELWPAEVAEQFRKNDLAVLESGQAIDVTEETPGPDGECITWWNFKFPFRDASGKRYVGGVGVDITQRLRMEGELRKARDELESRVRERTAELVETNEALRSSEEHFRRTFDQAPIGAAIVTMDYRFQRVNDALCRITGYSREELSGMSFVDITHPDDLQASLDLAKRLTSGEIDQYELDKRYLTRSGETVWVHLSVRLMRDVSGKPLYYLPMMEDITEQKRAQDRLEESEARFKSILDYAPAMIFIRDLEDRYVLVNRRYEETLGISEKNVIGKTPDEVLVKELADQVMKNDRKVLETESAHEMEEILPEAYGSRIVLSLKFPLRSTDGKMYAVCGILTDISDRKRAEEELQSYMTKLEESNKALQDFTSIASHDLQEPLRKVTSFGMRLKSKYAQALDETGKDYLERMLGAAERMQALLKALLEYSRVTTKAEPFVLFDLTTLIHEVLDDLEVRISETGGKVEVGDLPSIKADPNQMRRLFQNLIGNALKYHGEESPRIEVNAEPDGARNWRITVKDNGIGFEEKHLEKIFAPFQRLLGRSSKYEGAGMGLAICKKIVEHHGGSITARSALGQGSTFIVTLPIG